MLHTLKSWVKRRLPFVHWAWRRLTWPRPEKVFREIYHRNAWGDPESRSGTGSNLTQTARLRAELPGLLRRLEVRTLLDLPCGDFWWMQHVDLTGIDYLGGDIVPELIADNQRRYARPGRQFQVLDIIKDPLPRVDLVLCRDCLVHLSFEHIHQAVANLRRSGSNYLAATTYTNTTHNLDVPAGKWRTLNMLLPPFNFPSPVEVLIEGSTEADGQHSDKTLAVWRIADLPSGG
jgi:SAM-dependent methyltransferase